MSRISLLLFIILLLIRQVIQIMTTTSKQYGAHYSKSQSIRKQPIGKTTLEYLVKNDVGNYIHHQENIAQRTRHGLFTQPMGLANGDQYHDQKPPEVPKNMTVNQRLVQKVGPQLFQKMGSTNIGDLYKDKFRQTQLYVKQKTDLNIHNHAFGAGGKQKLVKNSEFEHMKEFNDKQYQTRDQFGNVKVGLKNVTTNNMKKGFGNTATGHLFGAYPYQGIPHDYPKELESQQKLEHKAKIPTAFRGTSYNIATFTPDHQVYQGESEPYQPKNDETQYRSKTQQKWTYNNPNKKSFYGTFTEFPKYIEQGEKPKNPIKNDGVWRPNYNGTSKNFGQTLAKPSAVASQMVLNSLRRDK